MKIRNVTIATLGLLAPAALQAQTAPAADATVAATSSSTPPSAQAEDVIVTGTRQQGRTKQNSPAPVDVISAAELQRTGSSNVFDALNSLLPSFELQAEGYDTAGLVRSARLRGLSPDDTLVLVDGKRRHISANINADVGPVGGSDPTDLDMIPFSLIDHIEVLRDGAAAQYGSDAIAGVINIILKHADHGGTAFGQLGQTYQGDGFDTQEGVSYAVPIGQNGYFDLGANYRLHEHTNRDGLDPRAAPFGITDNPARIQGDPKYMLATVGYNTAYDFGNITAYSFGTFGNRTAAAYENWRTPARFAGPWYASHYPTGYDPSELLYENDFAGTVGVKGVLPDDWHWDLSTTYGEDHDNIGVANDLNVSLVTPTSYLINPVPKHVHAGEFNNGQWTNNIDFTKSVDTPVFAAPLAIAFGGEFRKDTYQLQAGDFASSTGGGTSSYPGFTSADVSNDHRQNEAGYVDIGTNPLPHWQVDLAGRFEHYSDVGNTETGKFTTRYDFGPRFALRGTISNGFRAPTLGQEYAAEVNVGPTTAVGQLPATSLAARALGSMPLKPERSQNYSVGFTAEPIDRLHVAVDAYMIDIRDQIYDSGLIGATPTSDLALYNKAVAALRQQGINIAQSATFVAAQFYTNGLKTRTRGVDGTADYLVRMFDDSTINFTFAVNFNDVELKHVSTFADGTTEFTPDVLSEVTRNHPKNKEVLQGLWTEGPFTLMLRGTRWGSSSETVLEQANSAFYVIDKITPKFTGDIELGYQITNDVKFSVGAINFANTYPNKTPFAARDFNNSNVYSFSSPFGFDGGFYYARMNLSFGNAAPPPPPAPVGSAPMPPAPIPVRTYLVFFDWDRADLTQRAKQIVASAAEASTHVTTTQIEVNGYTDLSGTAAYNQKLSVRRAMTVKAELVHDGVAAGEIDIHGFGETHPLVATAKGVREPQNRRVEIILK